MHNSGQVAVSPQEKKRFFPPRTHGYPSAAVSAGIVLGILAMMIIPAAIALHSVRTPATLEVQPDASPHGYSGACCYSLSPSL
jgi:hypothetical protein